MNCRRCTYLGAYDNSASVNPFFSRTAFAKQSRRRSVIDVSIRLLFRFKFRNTRTNTMPLKKDAPV